MFNDVVERWDRWAGSARGRRDLRTWARRDRVFDGWSAAELRAPTSSHRTDAMQAGLVRLAQSGDAAAATTLMTQLRPGLVSLTRWVIAVDRRFHHVDEAEAEVVSVFWETLMRHRLDRRPRKIAANLLLDTRQHIWRSGGRQARTDAASVAAARTAAGPGDELARYDPPEEVVGQIDVLTSVAAALSGLSGSSRSRQLTAQLAYRSWILDEPNVEIARDLGLGSEAVNTRLCRLRSAVRAGNDRPCHRDPAHDEAQLSGLGSALGSTRHAGWAQTRRSEGFAPPSSPVGPSLASRQ